MNAANENKPKKSASKASAAKTSGGKCPICGKPTNPDFRPFCSKRCADVDLQRWFSGRYAIPAVEDDEDRDESDREF
ncbi:DNA gyrase inhibitor YacG [Microvirga sp. 17 mud 1-3]|uniref:DNA gyrase inhibitor YacG n=1 Tax=Microvirga sp. 17 mud 1-3 TaxID=2082949 RepID=UPI000D6AD469|nr:DNA gyrase inhibitor YacG [Microvirga sp. 17 mud 1-3]AWM87593.1 DNA gyrase inhibitor YacG [Microvirga sp. 17 mud 1-3]